MKVFYENKIHRWTNKCLFLPAVEIVYTDAHILDTHVHLYGQLMRTVSEHTAYTSTVYVGVCNLSGHSQEHCLDAVLQSASPPSHISAHLLLPLVRSVGIWCVLYCM